MQSVLQHRKREKTSDRPPETPTPSEDGCSSQNHGRDCIQFVTSAGVRARLSEMRDVNDGSHAGDQAGKNIDQTNSLRDRNAGVTRSRCVESDCVPGPSDGRTMQQYGVRGEDQREDRQLCRCNAPNVALTEKEE